MPKSGSASLPIGQRRFGAHMSIAGGLHTAFERGLEAGCDVLQVFVKNQRQWQARPLAEADVAAWRAARQAAGIETVVAHATYLINLAAPAAGLWKRSCAAYRDELVRCEQLGIIGLVVHPGSHVGAGAEAGIKRIVEALDQIHAETAGFRVKTLLEITAGQGTGIGHTFEEIAALIAGVRAPERVGVCFDTCHAFAAGYELRTAEGYAETMAAFDRTVGLERIVCFHVNDSVKPLGARVDRHAGIGLGCLGAKAFGPLVNDRRFLGRPMILETPKGLDDRGRDLDRVNLATLRKLTVRRRTAARPRPC